MCVYCGQPASAEIEVCAYCASFGPSYSDFGDCRPPLAVERQALALGLTEHQIEQNDARLVELLMSWSARCASLVNGQRYDIVLADGRTSQGVWLFEFNSFGSDDRHHISQVVDWS